MFKGLRLRLTLLYLLASMLLIALLGAGIYQSLRWYFQQTTDQMLYHKMAHEFSLLGAPIPVSLQQADEDWSILRFGNQRGVSTAQPEPPTSQPLWGLEQESTFAYDGELAAIFVLSLSADGRLLYNPGLAAAPIAPHQDSLAVALAAGHDLRTITTDDGSRVRLLTYALTRSDGPAALQLGRVLNDQYRLLWQVLTYIMLLAGVSILIMGFGSWWIAGQSLLPAQQAWERQQTFIANASHELRAPLTLLRASAEVAQRYLPPDDTDTRELLDDVLYESDHMHRLVEDLLLLSRLDAGKLEVACENILLPPLLADIQRQMGRLADEQGITLTSTPLEVAVLGDPILLRQVLIILLDNALHHTEPTGQVAVVVSQSAQDQWVQIAITDTGCGIAPEHLPHVFERFYRSDSTRTEQRKGAGLGLSIAKALVAAQQGQITVQSELGYGTCITVMLAAAPPPT